MGLPVRQKSIETAVERTRIDAVLNLAMTTSKMLQFKMERELEEEKIWPIKVIILYNITRLRYRDTQEDATRSMMRGPYPWLWTSARQDPVVRAQVVKSLKFRAKRELSRITGKI